MCIISNISSLISPALSQSIMGSTLCSRPQTSSTVVPVDQDFSQITKSSGRKASSDEKQEGERVLHPVSSWQREVSGLDSSTNSNHTNLNSSFSSRQSVKFFRRRSVRPSTESLSATATSSGITNKGLSIAMRIDGQLLKKYTVHNTIGKGAFSTVLLIEDKISTQQYALKIIEKKRSFRTNVPWERELDILKRVHHPNIIHLYETHSTTSKVYFVLELASGGDLRQRLNSVGYFIESRAQTILKPILDALCYLHRHGVTHRDLKLDNCLFKSSEKDLPILLSDFGLAHLQPKDKKSEGMQTTCGTVDYISPEMLEGEVYTEQVDMWSFGVITFTVLSGKMPFQDENKPRLFKKIREANYSFENNEVWNSTSNIAKDFIDKLLCVSTSQRLTAASALEHEWMTTSNSPS